MPRRGAGHPAWPDRWRSAPFSDDETPRWSFTAGERTAKAPIGPIVREFGASQTVTEDKRAGHEWAVLPRCPLPVAKAGFHAPARVTRRGSRPIETSRPHFQVMALTCALALPLICCKIAGLCPVRTTFDLHLYHGSLITWRDR